MTKAKKALSLILAVVMMFGVVSVMAFANDAPTAQNGAITLEYDKTSYAAGDTITVTAKLTTDYYAAATGIPLQFDDTAVTYVSNAKGAAGLYGSAAATEMVANVLTSAQNKYLYVAISPLSAKGAVAQKCSNVVLFTATFTAKTAIADTSAVFGILDDQKTMSHQAGVLYVGAYETSDVTSKVYTTGQVLAFPKMQAGPVGTPELVLTTPDNGAVIDKTTLCNDYDGFVYGVDTVNGEDIANFVTTAIGSVTVNTNDQGAYSTGATIELKDAAGTVIATYVFVYFGDVNGDGFVDGIDVSTVDGVASYMDFAFSAGDGSKEAMSVDINGDNFIDGIDVSIVDGVASYMDFTTQAEFAATVSAALGVA